MTLNPPTHSLSAHGAGWDDGRTPQEVFDCLLHDVAREDASDLRHLTGYLQPVLLQVMLRHAEDLNAEAAIYGYDIFCRDALYDADLWGHIELLRKALLANDVYLAEHNLRIQPPNFSENPAENIAAEDIYQLLERNASYGNSWLQRGGIGAFMVGIRKWDRILVHLKNLQVDSLAAAVEKDHAGPDGVYDDLKDFRRYLYLWEAERRRRVAYPEEKCVTYAGGALVLDGRQVGYLFEPVRLSIVDGKPTLSTVTSVRSAGAAPPLEPMSESAPRPR